MAEDKQGSGKVHHNGFSALSGSTGSACCELSATDVCTGHTKATLDFKSVKHGEDADDKQCNGTSLPLSIACAHEALIDSVIRYMDNDISISSLSEEAVKLLMLIPEGYIPVPHQVGGHRHVDGKFG